MSDQRFEVGQKVEWIAPMLACELLGKIRGSVVGVYELDGVIKAVTVDWGDGSISAINPGALKVVEDVEETVKETKFKVGDRVYHKIFGSVGRVESISIGLTDLYCVRWDTRLRKHGPEVSTHHPDFLSPATTSRSLAATEDDEGQMPPFCVGDEVTDGAGQKFEVVGVFWSDAIAQWKAKIRNEDGGVFETKANWLSLPELVEDDTQVPEAILDEPSHPAPPCMPGDWAWTTDEYHDSKEELARQHRRMLVTIERVAWRPGDGWRIYSRRRMTGDLLNGRPEDHFIFLQEGDVYDLAETE